MGRHDDTYCIFEPSEIKMVAMHATDLYFANLTPEERRELAINPVEYTTFYAKIYAETVKVIEEDMAFRKTYHER